MKKYQWMGGLVAATKLTEALNKYEDEGWEIHTIAPAGLVPAAPGSNIGAAPSVMCVVAARKEKVSPASLSRS